MLVKYTFHIYLMAQGAHNKFTCSNEETPNYWLMHIFAYECNKFKKFKMEWYCIFMHLVLCCQDVSSLGGYLPRCFILRQGSLNRFKHCSTCASIHTENFCLPIAMCMIKNNGVDIFLHDLII